MSPDSFERQAVDKPYAFVPFAPGVLRTQGPGHQCLELAEHNSGRLAYVLEALTPVFVGTGSYALGEDAGFPERPVVRPFYRVRGVPCIPGSSLKGVARSIVEAISPSCVTASRIRLDQLPQGAELATARGSRCTPTHACPACSIFGRMSQLAKVIFQDAHLLGDKGQTRLFCLAPLYAPHAYQAPRAYLGKGEKFQGRKFYYHSRPAEDPNQPPVEVLPVGARVQGQVDFENLTPAELGLLCIGVGLDRSLALKVGGGKPLGLGSLRLISASMVLLGKDHFLSPEGEETVYRGEALATFFSSALRAAVAQKLLSTAAVGDLMQILAPNDKRDAPVGMY